MISRPRIDRLLPFRSCLAIVAVGLLAHSALSAGEQTIAPPWDLPVTYESRGSALTLVSARCGLGVFMMGHGYELIGELRNEGTSCITDIRLKASMIPADGSSATAGDGTTMVDVLQPGEASPFSVGIYSAYGAMGSCHLAASWRETSQTPSRAVQFDVVQEEGPFSSMYCVEGAVVNADAVAALSVSIVFTCYGADGRIVDLGCVDAVCHNYDDLRCSDCSEGLSLIAPGGRALFKCMFLRSPNNISMIRGVIQYTSAAPSAGTLPAPQSP
jgi:hypothetical protein